MSLPTVEQFVISTISLASSLPEVAVLPETELADVNMDSLAVTSILGQVEAVYGMEFEPPQIARVFNARTVGDVIALVSSAVAGRAQQSAQ